MSNLLTKSKYLIGLQCHKYLWTSFNDKSKIPPTDPVTQFVFDQGHEVGEVAKRLFPDGINIPYDSFQGSVAQTQRLLSQGTQLFEASILESQKRSRRLLSFGYPGDDRYCDEVKISERVKRHMRKYVIAIEWERPLPIKEVIRKYNNRSEESEDCGLYQIYGHHILYGVTKKVLLYIGITCKQSFSDRFNGHIRDFLKDDNLDELQIRLGRIKDLNRYNKINNWGNWERDVGWAEQILIYKYLPSYNSACKTDYPKWNKEEFDKIEIIHKGDRGDLKERDLAPDDYLP